MPNEPTPAVRRLVEFLGTAVDADGDVLRDERRTRDWCRAHDLDPGRRAFAPDDLVRLRALRTGLRAAIGAPEAAAERRLGTLARRLHFGVALGPTGPALIPAGTGADGVVGRILLDAVAAGTSGAWSRIRPCGAPACERVFVDTTRSGNRTWCDMATCGNRTKVRAHRARTRAGASR